MSLSNNFPTILPTLLLDFANVGRLDPRITFTRASDATYFNSLGVLTTASSGVARFDYNPSTLQSLGLLIEEQRTNSIRNNTMQGAVAGTPGTLPTNWGSGTNASGLAWSVVGTGTEGGITYIDLRLSGTATSATEAFVFFESTTGAGASNGQTWTNSSYLYRVSGSATNITSLFCRTTSRITGGAAGSWTVNGTSVLTAANSSTSLSTVRATVAGTISDASALYVWPLLVVAHNAGAIDITLRIGLPQLELGAFATSVIPTTTTALTRNADVASMTGTNFSSWYNASEGTLFAQASLISSSYTGGVLVDVGAGGAFGTTEYIAWTGSAWTLNPNTAPINVTSSVTTTSTAKVAAGMKVNDSVIAGNGLIGVTDTSCSIASAPTTLSIGKAGWTAGNYLNGWIQRISYYPVRLPNSTLQALTL